MPQTKYILFQKRRFFFHNTCNIDPQGVASFDPRELIGRIYEGDYKALLYIKYISCEPNDSEEDFQSFSQVISLWELYVFNYLVNIYMKFHHILQTEIIDILLKQFRSYQNDLACIQNVKKTVLAIFCFSSFDTK